jgi:acyl carrier protein
MSTAEEIRPVVKEIVLSIKPLENGLIELPDDAPLFDDEEGEPSPLALDSLDTLDLALAIREKFDLYGEEFDRLLGEEIDLKAFRTVNDIVGLVVSVLPERTNGE